MDEIRIGIAGLGHRSLNWISLLQKVPGYRITAVYDHAHFRDYEGGEG